ncbi:hypothetical protein T03_13254 [Trichinella britovi]|uniref:Uncharacterized protein n=2 Tax=Trichinella TaxID=6333 RepID=A0A0V1CFG2_TRIBR|nr:hypothetical protein T05_14926 [Trichinella murrelli]KRY48036.1 hypothetical protein T03_13254 [Trichinella britovi]
MQPWPGEPICHLHHLIVQIKSAVETTYRSIMVELENNILPQNGNSQRPELHANTFASNFINKLKQRPLGKQVRKSSGKHQLTTTAKDVSGWWFWKRENLIPTNQPPASLYKVFPLKIVNSASRLLQRLIS